MKYLTTEDESHYVLGIINRFMRTIKDLSGNRVIDEEEMKELVDMYNKLVHSSTNVSPSKMPNHQEKEYIARKRIENQNQLSFVLNSYDEQ